MSINLLSNEYRTGKSYKTLTQASIIVLGVYIFVLLLISGVFFYLRFQKNSLEERANTLTNQVQSKKDVEELIVTIKNRTAIATGVYAKSAPSPSELITNLTALLPQNVTLRNINIEKEGNVNLVVKSSNSQGVSDLLQRVSNGDLNSVLLNTLAIGSDGDYVVSLSLKP